MLELSGAGIDRQHLSARCPLQEVAPDLEAVNVGTHTNKQSIDSMSARPSLQELRRSTLLDAEVVNQLQSEHPQALSCLQSAVGLLAQVSMLVFFLALDTSRSLFLQAAISNRDSSRAPNPYSMSFAISATILVVGLGLAMVNHGFVPAAKMCFNWRDVGTLALPGVTLVIATCCNTLAYTSALDGATIKILNQGKLPLTAICSAVLLKKKFTMLHWAILASLSFTIMAFYDTTQMNVQLHKLLSNTAPEDTTVAAQAPSTSEFSRGVIYMFFSVVFNVVSGLILEQILQGGPEGPFYVQKCQQELSSLFFVLGMSVLVPTYLDKPEDPSTMMWWSSTGKGFFQNWEVVTFMSLAINTLHSWIGGLIIKQFSSLVKDIVKSLSMVSTVIMTAIVFEGGLSYLPMSIYSLAIVVFLTSIIFGNLPKPPKVAPQAQQDVPAGTEVLRHAEANGVTLAVR